MSDRIEDFNEVESPTVVVTVDGTDYEFDTEDVPALKEFFDELEIEFGE